MARSRWPRKANSQIATEFLVFSRINSIALAVERLSVAQQRLSTSLLIMSNREGSGWQDAFHNTDLHLRCAWAFLPKLALAEKR
jgi:hypothetical protein